jgi:acetyltransferase-like isoleucine patch superfamily enzyme
VLRRAKAVVLHLVEDLLRPISGPLGVRLRRAYYRRRLKRCGSNLSIAPGVFIDSPEYVAFGDWVGLDRNVIIQAGPSLEAGDVKPVENAQCQAAAGEVVVGDRCHISIGCIVQGHGGIWIGHGFTASAGTCIYSLSNAVRTTKEGSVVGAGCALDRVRTPVAIGNNVWLGLHVVVIGNTIGDDTFIKPMSVVTRDVPGNAIAGGSPAVFEKIRYPATEQTS